MIVCFSFFKSKWWFYEIWNSKILFETRKYKSYNAIINGENDQPIDSDIQRYEEIWKLTTGQNEDYTTRRLLDYGYIKNHYRLIPVDLSRQKELDADPKAIKQIKLVGQSKKKKKKKIDATGNVTDAGNNDYSRIKHW